MRAAIFEAIGKHLSVVDLPDPDPGARDVIIQVGRSGICGSDLHVTADPIFRLQPGAVLGHEYAGDVIAVGSEVSRCKAGDRVAVVPISSCGRCAPCLSGLPAQCRGMQVEGGGYAQYARVHEQQCLRLPKSVSTEEGALVEPMAVALHGVRLSGLLPGARALIVGAGPIGLATAFWARRFGAVAVGVMATSMQRACLSLSMGATAFIGPHEAQPEAIASALGGEPEVVFECVGKPGLINRCIGYARSRGTIVGLGICAHTDHFEPFAAQVKELRLQMSAFYDLADFEAAIDAFNAGCMEPLAMVTDRISLDDLPMAFEALRHRGSQCKVHLNLN